MQIALQYCHHTYKMITLANSVLICYIPFYTMNSDIFIWRHLIEQTWQSAMLGIIVNQSFKSSNITTQPIQNRQYSKTPIIWSTLKEESVTLARIHFVNHSIDFRAPTCRIFWHHRSFCNRIHAAEMLHQIIFIEHNNIHIQPLHFQYDWINKSIWNFWVHYAILTPLTGN